MTDYPDGRNNSWKKREVARKWRSFIGVFVTIVLVFIAANGISKTVSVGKFFGEGVWDGKSAFAAVINSKPLSIIVYNPSAEQITLLKFHEDLYFATGDARLPLARIGDASATSNGRQLVQLASRLTRSPVGNFVSFDNPKDPSVQTLNDYFKSFASLTTPFKLMLTGPSDTVDTNIARIDMIKLWWQVKSLSVNNLNFTDAGSFQEDILTAYGTRVLGADSDSLHRVMSKYMQNLEILEEREAVTIENLSADIQNGLLARDFVLAIGAQVTNVNYRDGETTELSYIAAKGQSYTASYLAKIFNCGIKTLPNLGDGEIKVVIGRDFGQKL